MDTVGVDIVSYDFQRDKEDVSSLGQSSDHTAIMRDEEAPSGAVDDAMRATQQVQALLQALNVLTSLATLEPELYQSTIKVCARSDDDEEAADDALSTASSDHFGLMEDDSIEHPSKSVYTESTCDSSTTSSSSASKKSASDLQHQLDRFHETCDLNDSASIIQTLGQSIHGWHARLTVVQREVDDVRQETDDYRAMLQTVTRERDEQCQTNQALQEHNETLQRADRHGKRTNKKLIRYVRQLHTSLQQSEREKQELLESNRMLRLEAHERMLTELNQLRLSSSRDSTDDEVFEGSATTMTVGDDSVSYLGLYNHEFHGASEDPHAEGESTSQQSIQSPGRRNPILALTRALVRESNGSTDDTINSLPEVPVLADELRQEQSSPSRFFGVKLFQRKHEPNTASTGVDQSSSSHLALGEDDATAAKEVKMNRGINFGFLVHKEHEDSLSQICNHSDRYADEQEHDPSSAPQANETPDANDAHSLGPLAEPIPGTTPDLLDERKAQENDPTSQSVAKPPSPFRFPFWSKSLKEVEADSITEHEDHAYHACDDADQHKSSTSE